MGASDAWRVPRATSLKCLVLKRVKEKFTVNNVNLKLVDFQ